MSLYDDYFTNDDKPFAENLNDALLLSNVFDLTVPIELPRMFNNGEWSTGTGQRKAGVSIIQTEGIDGNDVVIDNYEDEQGNTVCALFANSDATVLITVYPNFNQYGNLQKVYWEFEEASDENLTIDVLTEQGTALLTNIPNNSVLSSVPYLQQLNKFILRLNFEGGTGIKKLGFIMQNKQQDRYGAEVGISDVTGLNSTITDLESSIDGLDSAITTGLNGKVDKVSGKGLSTNDFTTGFKQDVENLTTYVEQHITPWDNQNFYAYGNSPLKFYRLGRVCNLRGEWRCNNAQSTSSPLKVFHNIPNAPSTDIVTLQAGQGKNTYKCKITSDGEMYVQDYGVDSTINLPAKTSFYVNIVWFVEW